MIILVYCSASQVRELCGFTTSEANDTTLTSLISHATKLLNRDIQNSVIREKIVFIDNTRKNKIDGSNTTFYVKNWQDKYIGDGDDDGDVDTSDITVYQVASDGTETTLTVSTITPNEGKFVLSSAPTSGARLYVTYRYAPVSMSDPHGLVNLAAIFLTGSFVATKLETKKIQQYAVGRIRISKQSDAYNKFYDLYDDMIYRIRNRLLVYSETDILTNLVLPGYGR